MKDGALRRSVFLFYFSGDFAPASSFRISAALVSFAGEFRRLRAASYFAHGGKVTKTPPGTAPDEHFVLIVAFPRTPLRGLPLESGKEFPARKI